MYELIKTRFSKAIQHYDNNAVAQRTISDWLFELLLETVNTHLSSSATKLHLNSILEIGCGTGNFSAKLASLSPKELMVSDICPEYKEIVLQKLSQQKTTSQYISSSTSSEFICAEALELINGWDREKLSCIASTSAIQWLENPLQFLINCKNILAPNGLIAISTFSPDNLLQIKQICGTTLKYNTLEEIMNTLSPHYNILHLSSSTINLTFTSPTMVLKHLKQTGVNGISSQTWTKKDLEQFTNSYNALYRDGDGLCTLTYAPIYLVAQVKGR